MVGDRARSVKGLWPAWVAGVTKFSHNPFYIGGKACPRGGNLLGGMTRGQHKNGR